MSEKRVFIPKRELGDSEKESQKRYFINTIKKQHKININPNELIETDDGNKWSIMFCDGVHIYSLTKYRNGKGTGNHMYTADERKKLRKFFLQFTSVILGKQLNEDNLLEDEDETTYALSYREEEKELLTFQYKKRNVN